MSEDEKNYPRESVVDDDIWGDAPVKQDSAFSEPSPVVDLEHDDGEQELAPKEVPKGAPNYAILAVAALIGVGILGGGGYFGYTKLFPGNRVVELDVATDVMPPPVSSIASTAAIPMSGVTGGGVFDMPAADRDALPAVVPAPSLEAQGAPAKMEGLVAASSSPEPASVQAVEPSKPAVTVPEQTLGAEKRSPEVVRSGMTPKTPKTPKAAKEDVLDSKVATSAANNAKKSVKPKKAPGYQVARKQTKKKIAKRVTEATPVAQSIPEAVKNVRLVGVYPLSGKNAQAWISNGQGATIVVRKGDTINGINILEVIPEKNLVRTSVGTVSTSGVGI